VKVITQMKMLKQLILVVSIIVMKMLKQLILVVSIVF